MTTFPKTLKDTRTCRVFVSSPFGGCEKEREELAAKYFPQLSHLCQSKGVQFVTVDMRWGITEEAATDAQVINICLREVDRSDIFVGFYGQRYGWHGSKDEKLQKNFENALSRYPWLAAVTDRSVTELEFLHGHLNNPGALPTIMAFRDKVYDQSERLKSLKSKDHRSAKKFEAESEDSKMLLANLKNRVIRTKDKCLALNERYATPEEGAKFIFEQIKLHLEAVLLNWQMSTSKRDMDLASHNAYMSSRVSVFVGGEDHERKLDLALQTGDQNVLIIGPTGSGKGALIAHWLSNLQRRQSKYSLIYHFVGCSSNSANTPEVLTRLITETNHVICDVRTSVSESLQNMDEQLKPKRTEVSDLFREFELNLGKAAAKHPILLVIDGVGKVQNTSKISKTLFWLPRQLPKKVTIVCTCREKDTDIIEELTNRGYHQLYIPDLTKQLRHQMCTQLLTHNSKELSVTQLQKIVDSKQCGSPLYLKTVISELCTFGQFRELDAKIDELIACRSVQELFQALIRRLEADYATSSTPGNIIEQVLCSIRVSRKGLSEIELMRMHTISSKDWSPLFFAMQHVMVEVAGLLKFGFHELADAVDEIYMIRKGTRLKYQTLVAEYFDQQRKVHVEDIHLDDTSIIRPADELPWLFRDMDDKKKLMEVLADLRILGRLFLDQEYELLELWQCTDLTGEQIASIYLNDVKRKTTCLKGGGEHEGQVVITLISCLNALSYFMEMACYRNAQEMILLAGMEMLEKASTYVPETSLKKSQTMMKMKLAYLYTDTGRYEEAAVLHRQVLEYRKEYLREAVGEAEQHTALKGLASSYHGIAMLNSKLDRITEAIEYYRMAMETQKQLDDEVDLADSLHNLGVMYMKVRRYQEALDLCCTSLKIYQDVYFANLPPVIGVMIGNIAVCHRHLGQVNQAESMYMKALDIAERAVGRQHPHVALSLMNLGTLEINRQQFVKAEVYIRESIDIFEKCGTLENDVDFYKSLEKFVYVLIKVNKVQEALDRFNKLFKIAVKEKFLDTSWPNAYILVVDCLIELKDFHLAHDVALTLLNSKQAQDKSYIQYDTICEALERTPVLEYSLENALRQRPGSLSLLRQTIEKKFVSENSLVQINTSLDEADRCLGVGADLYGTAVAWCEEADRPDLAHGILEHAAQLFPDEPNFVCGLAQSFYESENWEKAKEYSWKMCKLDPENPNHFLLYGDMAIRTGDMEQAKITFNHMLDKFSQNETVVSQARQALDMLNKADIKTPESSQ